MERRRPSAPVLVLAILALGLGACDGDDVAAPEDPAPTVTVTVTETAAPSPLPSPPPPATTPAGPVGCEQLEMIGETLAFLVVEAPDPGDAVPSPFTVTGCANVFEASFQWELLDSQGQVLDSGFGTATCGTGCVGALSFQVSYAVDELQVGTLRVFTTSPRDGSVEHLNAIPVVLQP